MAELGTCPRCAGQLGVLQGYAQDSEGRLLGEDGQPVRMRGEQPAGPIRPRFRVACTTCQAPVPEHPHQRELDQAEEERKHQRLHPPVAAAHTYTLAGSFDAIEVALRSLRSRQNALDETLTLVRAELAELRRETSALPARSKR